MTKQRTIDDLLNLGLLSAKPDELIRLQKEFRKARADFEEIANIPVTGIACTIAKKRLAKWRGDDD